MILVNNGAAQKLLEKSKDDQEIMRQESWLPYLLQDQNHLISHTKVGRRNGDQVIHSSSFVVSGYTSDAPKKMVLRNSCTIGD